MTAPIAALLQPRHLAWAASVAASLATCALAILVATTVLGGEVMTYDVGNWAPPYGIQLRVAPINALTLLLVTFGSAAALLIGYPSIRRQIEADRQPYFFAVWLLAAAGLTGITVTGDAFNVFVFMEVSSLASYVLIASGPDRRSLTATFKYLCMGTIGATFYLIGVGLIYMETGTLNMADMAARLGDAADSRIVLTASGFITIGLALKTALFPLHAWLPEAYARAPHAVTAFIAAASTKVQLLVLIQFDFLVFQPNLAEHAQQLAVYLIPMATAGVVIGAAVAMLQRDLKKLLAWSSISQIGYIVLGTSLSTKAGLAASIHQTFAHGLAKGTAFLTIALAASRVRSFHLSDLRGAMRGMPWTMSALVVAGISLIGMPGTAGFISKWLLISAAAELDGIGPYLIGAILLSSLFAVAYVWKFIEVIGFGEPPQGAPEMREAPILLLAALWAVALTNVWFGFDTSITLKAAFDGADALWGAAQ